MYVYIYITDAIQGNTYPNVSQDTNRSTGGIREVLPVIFITDKISLVISIILTNFRYSRYYCSHEYCSLVGSR